MVHGGPVGREAHTVGQSHVVENDGQRAVRVHAVQLGGASVGVRHRPAEDAPARVGYDVVEAIAALVGQPVHHEIERAVPQDRHRAVVHEQQKRAVRLYREAAYDAPLVYHLVAARVGVESEQPPARDVRPVNAALHRMPQGALAGGASVIGYQLRRSHRFRPSFQDVSDDSAVSAVSEVSGRRSNLP